MSKQKLRESLIRLEMNLNEQRDSPLEATHHLTAVEWVDSTSHLAATGSEEMNTALFPRSLTPSLHKHLTRAHTAKLHLPQTVALADYALSIKL